MQTRSNNYSKQSSGSLQCFPGSAPSRSLTPVDTARVHGAARPALHSATPWWQLEAGRPGGVYPVEAGRHLGTGLS